MILIEVHSRPYVMHPRSGKMYHSLKEVYWWPSLKRDVTDFVTRCLVCQKVKAEHQFPSGNLLQILNGSGRGLLRILFQKLVELYIVEIVHLHGIPVLIISDRDPGFTSRKCRTPLCWIELDERRVVGTDLVREIEEKVKLICGRLKVASDRKKSYADMKHQDINFQVGDKRIGLVAYGLNLPSELERICDAFNVSMLRKYRSDPSHIVPVEEIEICDDLSSEEEPVEILDHELKVLLNNFIG
ncbi:uncharacterized protein [Gossypium hirsutum]|uniref:Integrase zinc-binding domain-containing protein n=1 Tax=Gossypium hirsutum TaxID=3635 RepID=A0A1U8MY96_GOSHI|nr:uncharacterized protein LOC107941466 [Gossypium hirsutum]